MEKDQIVRSQPPITGRVEGWNGLSPVGQPDGSEIDVFWIWGMLARGKKILFACVVASLLAGAAYLFLKTRRYEAVADLAVHPESSDALNLSDTPLSGLGDDWSSRLETEVRVLKSATLAQQVIDELHLENNQEFKVPPNDSRSSAQRRNAELEHFAGSLTVSSIPHTQVIEIRFRNSDPKTAADVVNTLSRQYQERNFVTRYQATKQASSWLTQQLNDIKGSVEDAQQKLAEYQKKTGIIGSDENNNIVMSKLDELNRQLNEAQADRIEKEAKYRISQAGNADLVTSSTADPHMLTLKQQQRDLEAQLADAQTHYGKNYPKVVQLHAQLDQVRQSIASEMQAMNARYQNEYLAAKNTEDSIRAAFDRQKQQAYRLSEGFSQYGILRRQVDSGRDLYEDLLKRLEEAGVVASLRSTNVDIIDAARIPTNPVEPRIALSLLLACLAGLCFGILGVFVNDRLDQTIGSPEDIETASSLPVLTIVPQILDEKSSKLKRLSGKNPIVEPRYSKSTLALQMPRSQFSESFRTLRTAIRLACAGAPPKVIVVTSSAPGEGKSTVSTNCATVLAQSGSRVLLVDGDMRRGVLATSLGLDPRAGLSECLAGTLGWREALQVSEQLPNLHVLGSGTRPPSPADLLDSTELKKLVEEWSAEYNHIVLDTPPALLVTDALVMASFAQAILVVARHHFTNRHALKRMCDVLQGAFPAVCGVILNGFESEAYGYYAGYSAYGYGKRGYDSYYHEEPKTARSAAQ